MKLSVVVMALVLSACSIMPQSPAQTVYVAKIDHAAALIPAVAYKHLPACSDAVKPPCSDIAVVGQLQMADDVADGALDAAETAVRTPGFGKDVVRTAVAAANAAVAALVSITNTLRSK